MSDIWPAIKEQIYAARFTAKPIIAVTVPYDAWGDILRSIPMPEVAFFVGIDQMRDGKPAKFMGAEFFVGRVPHVTVWTDRAALSDMMSNRRIGLRPAR